MENSNGRETIVTMLLIECIRRLTKDGKKAVHITNEDLKNALANGYEVDFSESDSNKFVLRLATGEVEEVPVDGEGFEVEVPEVE